MKSSEVYAILKQELDPLLKASGFKRAKSLLSWSRPHDGQHIVVWCQVSQDGWDDFAGSKFVVEFQRSGEPIVGAHPARRQRLASLLADGEREEIRRIQNAVISNLRRPAPTHPNLHISPEVTKSYLAKFELVREPYPERHDIWLRYAMAEHVHNWGRFVAEKLPGCVRELESWS